MSDQALPPHLRGRKHNDWPWPFKGVSRGWNATGPRAPLHAVDYAEWPPRLVEGHGVARWESSGGESIILIPDLVKKTVKGDEVYGRNFKVIEMNPGAPDFLSTRMIKIPEWRPSAVWDVRQPDGKYVQQCDPDQYSPSALQKFSPSGWVKLEPFYYAWHRILEKRELPEWPEKGDDTVMFMRRGARPDHVDLYYNTDKFVPVGFVGLKWE